MQAGSFLAAPCNGLQHDMCCSMNNPAISCRQGGATAAGAAAAAAPDPDPEPELQYDDSSVRRYVCEVLAAGEAGQATGNSSSGAGGSTGAIPARARVAGFRRLPGCLHDPALARAYSVDSRPGLVVVSWQCRAVPCCAVLCCAVLCFHFIRFIYFCLALDADMPSIADFCSLACSKSALQAGGKDGVVAVWGSRQLEAGHLSADDSVPPLLSHKLHKGWWVYCSC